MPNAIRTFYGYLGSNAGTLATTLAVMVVGVYLIVSFERAWLATKPEVVVVLTEPRPELDALVVRERVQALDRFSVSTIRDSVRSLKWVSDVAVRLRWPHSIEVLIGPKQLVARLDEDRLLFDDGTAVRVAQHRGSPTGRNARGVGGGNVRARDASAARDARRAGAAEPRPLPMVRSSAYNLSNAVLAERVKGIVAALGGRQLERVRVSDFGGWTVQTVDGLRVELGSEDLDERLLVLARYMSSGALEKLTTPVLDLRHGKGIALSVEKGGARQK